jgi:hypothetical protein
MDAIHTKEGNMSKFIKLDPDSNDTVFDDDHKFLLPRWIRGFTLGTRGHREWGEITICIF